MAWTGPSTYVAGVLVNAATLNAVIRDNLNWLYSGDASWTTPSLGGGVSAGTPAPRYKRVGGTVTMQGSALTTGAAPVTLFTLPVGYRPSIELIIAARCATSSGPNIGDLRVKGDGTVYVAVWASGFAGMNVDCTFPIEQ